MAYTICDEYGNCKPLQMIAVRGNEPVLLAEFTPHWWVCDPCNHESRRYEIYYRANSDKPHTARWYEVVTSDDTDGDISLKLSHYRKVLEARKRVEQAKREWERLNGMPYPEA